MTSSYKKEHFLSNLSAKHPILFLLDYDGTLTDFKKDPKHSRISPSTRSFLYQLQSHYPVVIVTGRYIDNLFQISGLKRFSVIGSHGFEARNLPNGLYFASASQKKFYRKEAIQLWRAIQILPSLFPGIHVERKPFSSSIHFRGLNFTSKQISRLYREFNALYRKAVTPRRWNLHMGKKMIEVTPKGFSKGKSVQILLKHYPGHLVIYAGDDKADISVFKILGRKGLKIAVGNHIPRKYYDLKFDDPRLFVRWLKSLKLDRSVSTPIKIRRSGIH